jgi:hypothetical protein
MAAGATDPKTGKRYEMVVLPKDGAMTRLRAPVVEEHLKALKAPTVEQTRARAVSRRVRYAAMRGHMELAAHVIAVGGTKRQAAQKAGVSKRQISKYLSSGDFRDRIQEIQELLGGKIRGRIMAEVNRRTDPEVIKKMELLDLLRVGDRFGLGRGAGSIIVNDNREVHNYESTFNALFHNAQNAEQLSDTGEESADFPEFEPTSLSLSGGDPSVGG